MDQHSSSLVFSDAPSVRDPKFLEYFCKTKNPNIFLHFYDQLKGISLKGFNEPLIENIKQVMKTLMKQRSHYAEKSRKLVDDFNAMKESMENMKKMSETLDKKMKEMEDQRMELERKLENQKNSVIESSTVTTQTDDQVNPMFFHCDGCSSKTNASENALLFYNDCCATTPPKSVVLKTLPFKDGKEIVPWKTARNEFMEIAETLINDFQKLKEGGQKAIQMSKKREREKNEFGEDQKFDGIKKMFSRY